MMLVRSLLIVVSLLFAGAASAVPITFSLDNVTIVGGSFPTSQTYVPALPLAGSGDIDFGAGTGTLTLPNHAIILDISMDLVLDAQLDITGWTQNISAIDGSGNITSTGAGAVTCTVLGGIGGLVCPTVSPTVAGWPPASGTLASSAVIDTGLQTITVVDNSSSAAGTVTQFYSYTIVPEPSTALLFAAGLVALAQSRRRS